MKIFELAKPQLVEGHVEPNALYSVANVVRRGKATNLFEFIVMTRFLQLLKLGRFYDESNPIFEPTVSTDPVLLSTLKALPDEQIHAIASKLLQLLDLKNRDVLAKYANPEAAVDEWLRFVTSREAND